MVKTTTEIRIHSLCTPPHDYSLNAIKLLSFPFTANELDPETGFYYYGARYLEPKTSRWISGDPAMAEYLPSAPVNDEARKRNGNLPGMGGVFNYVNLHCYHYAGNNPVRYIDPDGRSDIDDIQQQIKDIQNQIANVLNNNAGGDLSSLKDNLFDLFGQYNRAVIAQGNLGIWDYVQNGRQTEGFNVSQDLSGSYQTNAHPGIDGVGGYAKTPFYTQATGSDSGRSNTVTLDIIGTELKIQILHGDKGSYIRSGDFYRPGQMIMPFPSKNNSPESSTGPHFHFQISNGTQFLNPLSLQTSSTVFKFSNNGGRTWDPFRTDF